MEQLFELPKAVQKNVLDFQRKFRTNSKSEAIHLEPIKVFKDKQLRTARITDKYRAIIRVPETGDNYYLLWVDNHDEAMDWAKNKIFQWNEHTQAAQIFNAPEITESASATAIPESKALYARYSDDQLLGIGVPESLIVIVRSIYDLNDLSRIESQLPADAFENLFYLSEGYNIDALISEVNEGRSATANENDSFNNKRSFVEINDELMEEIIHGELSKWQIFLHPSQRKLVESDFKGSVKVTGGAGTGKTVVALHRLKHFADHLDTSQKDKIVFTTFTNALTTNLVGLSKKMGIDQSRVVITNIDSLVRELADQFKLKAKSDRILDMQNTKSSDELWNEVLEQTLSEFDLSFIKAEHQNVILYNNIQDLEAYLRVSRIGRGKPITRKQKMDLWQLIEIYNDKKQAQGLLDRSELFNIVSSHLISNRIFPFKHVIADEVQDMSNIELRFLRSLTEPKENDLFLVGDPYQKIYAKKINFSSAGISIRGNRSKQLRINYRTSEEIKRLALTAIQGLSYDDFDGESEKLNGYLSLFHGEKPTYEIFKTKGDEIAAIVDYIKEFREKGLRYNDIAIGFRTKDALKDIKTSLHKLKIPYNDNTTTNSNDHSGVVLSTFHGMKGLEFKAVILSDVNNRTCPLHFGRLNENDEMSKEDYLNSEKSLLYVAISRAIQVLRLTGTGVKSEMVRV